MAKEKKMKIIMKIFGLAILMTIFGHCNKDALFKDDELHHERVSYTGDELRIDGYYYERWGDNPERLTIYFFYENGVVFGGDSPPINEIEKIEREFKDGRYYETVKNYKTSWGVFQIKGNKILFERWYPSQPPLKAYVREGVIINDTTFMITESYRMQNGKKTEIKERNETYQFKAFSPKPDSTNKFTK